MWNNIPGQYTLIKGCCHEHKWHKIQYQPSPLHSLKAFAGSFIGSAYQFSSAIMSIMYRFNLYKMHILANILHRHRQRHIPRI